MGGSVIGRTSGARTADMAICGMRADTATPACPDGRTVRSDLSSEARPELAACPIRTSAAIALLMGNSATVPVTRASVTPVITMVAPISAKRARRISAGTMATHGSVDITVSHVTVTHHISAAGPAARRTSAWVGTEAVRPLLRTAAERISAADISALVADTEGAPPWEPTRKWAAEDRAATTDTDRRGSGR